MVFSSVPVYLDPPNWPQQPGSGGENPNHPPPMPPPPPPVGGGGGGGTGSSIRPGSMTDRARLAKLPMPEAALKCPRCESTNTKFCYFNNYSLSQPRHFCKTCRRYWTRGGTLRNVPVGGGCRRNNKKSKRTSRSKSPVTQVNSSNGCTTNNMVVHFPPPPPQLPFLPSLQHLGFAFEGADVEFQMGNNSSSGARFTENWRLQQFPLLEPPPGIYQFDREGVETLNYQFGSKPFDSRVTHDQLDGVKMEENQGLNLSRSFLCTNNQYWGGNAWTDLNAPISSSSTAHHLL